LAVIIAGFVFSDEYDYDEVLELLMAEPGYGILYLSRVNLGILGEESWIASRGDGNIYIYTVNNVKEVRCVDYYRYTEQSEIRYWDHNIHDGVELEYDILQYIPGVQIGNKALKFGDFNGDSIDEIFYIDPSFESNKFQCVILRYDREAGKMGYPFHYTFSVTSAKGPIPIGFTNYRGTDGIVVQTINLREQITWYFFAHNEETQEYERMTAISEDEIDFSTGTIVIKESSQNTNEDAIENVVPVVTETELPLETTTITTAEDGTKSDQFDLIIIILIGSAAVLAAVVILFTARKKKN
jgi:hypothetical protein